MRELRTMLLEDRELVTMLRTARKNGDGWRSDFPHSGLWGSQISYILVPCHSRASVIIRTKNAMEIASGMGIELENRSSDAEVLLLGTHEAIDRMIREGPKWCRAMLKRKVDPSRASHLHANGSQTA